MKNSRRDFLNQSLLAALTTLIGSRIVFSDNLPSNYVPVALEGNDPFQNFKKHKDMIVLNDKPWNIESMPHLLDDRITPNEKMFVRNNGLIPRNIDLDSWTLTIDGESASSTKTYSLNDLKTKFQHYTYQLTLECGGNGRKEFNPPAKGNQWALGAVSCAEWTGFRLSDVLKDAGIKSNAVYIGYYGVDVHLTGNPEKVVISRGVPISKAMEDETLLAFKMNGQDIPLAHGYPLRLVAGGWPASVSGKWLKRISVRDRVHDGPKMEAPSYRIPCEAVAPGEKVAKKDMCIIESMPVKSLITYPKTGAIIDIEKSLNIRGHAWAGDLQVKKMEYSIDFGATWNKCPMEEPANRLAWQHFSATIYFPKKGYYEVWARATDSKGKAQPMVLPGWNPKGYLNNACHRIAVKVK
ncbi:sulfite oxidase [Flavobacteriales bacterium]|nr:sulfite oxidase [Flavobacteriales bacterium]